MKKPMRFLTMGLCGLSLAFVLPGCGGGSGGSSSSAPATIQYSAQPAISSGSTEITGIRGVTGSSDVYITGINQDNGTNYALLYQGPIQMTSASQWNRIGPTKCIVTTQSSCEQSSGLNFYGPNNGSSPGNVVVVGNYNLPNDRFPYGLLYRGDVSGNGTYTKIDPSSLLNNPSDLKYTIAHSNMNGYVVGNYAKSDAVGHAFIMGMGSTPDDPSTYTYYSIPESLVNGAISMTAYGIWYNEDRRNYTIVGGFSKLDTRGLSTGFIVDWDSATQQFNNFTPVYYNNDQASSLITHFEGITTDDAGGYYLAADWGTTNPKEGAALVQVKRNADGSFATPSWTMLAYPGATITSANTVYRKNVLGIFANPVTPYLATVP